MPITYGVRSAPIKEQSVARGRREAALRQTKQTLSKQIKKKKIPPLNRANKKKKKKNRPGLNVIFYGGGRLGKAAGQYARTVIPPTLRWAGRIPCRRMLR